LNYNQKSIENIVKSVLYVRIHQSDFIFNFRMIYDIKKMYDKNHELLSEFHLNEETYLAMVNLCTLKGGVIGKSNVIFVLYLLYPNYSFILFGYDQQFIIKDYNIH